MIKFDLTSCEVVKLSLRKWNTLISPHIVNWCLRTTRKMLPLHYVLMLFTSCEESTMKLWAMDDSIRWSYG